jgi:putative hemolysin
MEENQRAENQEPFKDFLDVDSVFKKKGKKLYPFIPKFVIKYLERIVHQDEMNAALRRHHHLKNFEFLEQILIDEFKVKIQANNIENLPESGRYFVVGNHPLGGLDGMALMHLIGKKRQDLKSVSNDILMELKSLRDLFVPVNKHGRNSAEMVKTLNDLFASDAVVMIFPAGLVSRKQKGKIYDLEWKKTFVTKAVQFQRDIIPVHIDGRNSSFFYNFANLRKLLRIKANIEMLYLPDEMFKQKNKKITITFGERVPYSTFTNELTHAEWAQRMKEHVYGLPQGKLKFTALK